MQFGIKRAAPGTCFALFGAALISVMVAQGLPEFSQQHTAAASGSARALTMKGLGSATDTDLGEFRIALRRADALMAEGARDEAAAAYARALTHSDVPLGVAARGFNQLGWLAYLDGRPERAIALAELAVGLEPTNSEYRDTLARAREQLAQNGAGPDRASQDLGRR